MSAVTMGSEIPAISSSAVMVVVAHRRDDRPVREELALRHISEPTRPY